MASNATTASAAAAAAIAAHNEVNMKAMVAVEEHHKKRRLDEDDTEDGFTEEESETMNDVMAKITKGHHHALTSSPSSLAAAAAAAVAAAVNGGDDGADHAAQGIPGAELVTAANAAAVAGVGAVADPNRGVKLYDSKRMSRVSFNSWFEFDSYFEMYMQETFQPFRMRSSCSVEAYRRNQQKVMMNNKNSRGRRIEFPDTAIHHHRIYMCTHAMKARCRGATTRPGQKYRGIGCIAKINVKISPSDNPSKYMVIVTDQVVTHNHPISREIYESYPDVLLKTMRRTQLPNSLVTRQPPPPKFENPAQSQKYERVASIMSTLADAMARLSDEDFEIQYAQLQKIYANSITDNAQV